MSRRENQNKCFLLRSIECTHTPLNVLLVQFSFEKKNKLFLPIRIVHFHNKRSCRIQFNTCTAQNESRRFYEINLRKPDASISDPCYKSAKVAFKKQNNLNLFYPKYLLCRLSSTQSTNYLLLTWN